MESKSIDSRHLFKMILEKKKVISSLGLGITCIGLGIVLATVDLLPVASKYFSQLKNGSPMHERVRNKFEAVTIEIYLFNITNGERFLSGQDHKLKLEEVGPFVYRQERLNKNVSLDDERHILGYTASTTNNFVADRSIGDPHDVYLNLPNVGLLAISSKVSKHNWLVKTSYKMLTAQHQSNPIMNISVQDYLWGYDDPLVRIGNQLIPGVFHFKKLGLLDRFFDPKNYLPLELDATDENKFEIKTMDGIGGLKGLGYLEKRSYCNSFNNTYEGIMFPYKMSAQRKVREYHAIYCRILDLELMRNETMEYGSEAMVYRIRKDAFDHNVTENECICPSGGCLNGVSDLSPCFFDLPLGLSLAHFLNAEEKAFERIEGLSPNETLHGSEFHIDKEVGLALATRFTIQYNLMLGDLSFIPSAKTFSNMVVPFVWIKVVQPPLPDDVIMQLRLLYVYMPKVMVTSIVLLILTGLGLLVYSYRQMSRVTKRQPESKMGYKLQLYEKQPSVIMNTVTPLITAER